MSIIVPPGACGPDPGPPRPEYLPPAPLPSVAAATVRLLARALLPLAAAIEAASRPAADEAPAVTMLLGIGEE